MMAGLGGGASGNFTREMMCTLTIHPTGHSICWDSDRQKERYEATGLYEPRDMIPIRFQTYQDTTFLAFPRYRCGVPATLMSFRMDDFCRVDPILSAFPSFKVNNASQPTSLINVIDLFIDDYEVLWTLDLGVINTLSRDPETVTGPQIYGFCPKSGSMLSRIPLCPFTTEKSRLQFLQAEVTDTGQTYLYISDAGTNSIIVWNVDSMVGFKVALPCDVTDYPLSKDVLYIAVIKNECYHSILYFTYLMGKKMYSIKTCLIREGKVQGAVTTVGKKPGPMVVLGTDGGRTMYLRLRQGGEIFLWNTDKEFRPRSLVLARGETSRRLPTHVAPGYRRLMWVLESNFYDYFEGTHSSLGVQPRLAPLVKFCDPLPGPNYPHYKRDTAVINSTLCH